MRMTKWILCTLVLVSVWGLVTYADVKPHALISENMVLQQGMKVPIWGIADVGEKVTVEFQGQKASTESKDGKWMVYLKPLKVGGPYSLTIQGKNTVTINNVLVGEVWIGSGQSNMQMSVKSSNNSEQEIANAKFPKIRLFSVPRIVTGKPLQNIEGKWVECSPETVPEFSAVLYFFGRELHQVLNVPVGLIHTSWGGTPAESWTTHKTLESDPDYKPILDRWQQSYDKYLTDFKAYGEKVGSWLKETEALEAAVKPMPDLPKPPDDPRKSPWRPASLFNAMISPLLPYGIQGAIWYQGESNASRAYQYRKLFPAMITDWRKQWGQGDFPFLFVQLANFDPQNTGDTQWAELREAQTMTLSLPKTGMSVTTDIGDAKDIHPRNKQDVGKRLALAAEKIAYGKKMVYSGPMYKSMKVKKQDIILQFTNIGGGLMAQDGLALKGFEIAGKDQKFVPATAKIQKNTVVVSSDAVKEPAAVRYSWRNNPDGNLYNKEKLPAVPFRTDQWPGVTKDAK